jgi:DnaJ-class molecular chaperone
MMRDPYDILGVARSAPEADIKKAYRKLAKAHHPDRNKNDPKAKDKFAEVNAAYEILGDAAKRAQFDRGEIDAEGKPRFQGFEGFGAGAGAGREGFESFNFNFGGGSPFGRRRGARPAGEDDIFSQLFGEAFRSAERGARARAPKGEDVQATLSVTLEDIAGEAKKRITLPTGREVEVTIPKGVADGQTIRLRGLGESASGGAGDALLTIRIAPHERFTAEGDNIRVRVPIDLADAVLGAKVRVPTLTGPVEMSIPPMTSSGRTFRLRGKGLPGKSGKGDLLVTTEIRLPDNADEALLEYARKRRAERVD